MRMICRVLLAGVALLSVGTPSWAQKVPSWTKDVKPFLVKYCAECHSGACPKGGLDVTKYADLKQGGNTDVAFVPGKPDASLIVKLVEKKQDPHMPPKDAKVQPKPAEVGVLREWIKAGAKDDTPKKTAADDLLPPAGPEQADLAVALETDLVDALAPVAAPSFAKDIQPFLNKYCVECHKGREAKAGVNLESFQGLMKGDKKGRAMVIPGNPDTSRLIHTMDGRAKQMPPKKSPQPTAQEVARVRAWIKAGAKDDSKGTVGVTLDMPSLIGSRTLLLSVPAVLRDEGGSWPPIGQDGSSRDAKDETGPDESQGKASSPSSLVQVNHERPSSA